MFRFSSYEVTWDGFPGGSAASLYISYAAPPSHCQPPSPPPPAPPPSLPSPPPDEGESYEYDSTPTADDGSPPAAPCGGTLTAASGSINDGSEEFATYSNSRRGCTS
jgi:hypothetical protein